MMPSGGVHLVEEPKEWLRFAFGEGDREFLLTMNNVDKPHRRLD